MTTHFFGKFAAHFLFYLLAFSAPQLGCAICSRRFPGEPFKYAIELREGLKSDLERDLADSKIAVCQKVARLVEPGTRNVVDKIYAGHLLELLAEMIPANAGRFRYLAERKFFGRMSLDELSSLPDFHRLSSTLVVQGLLEWVRRYHL